MGKQVSLPYVSSRRGAPFGRTSVRIADPKGSVKLRLYRMRLVDGDYDNGGAYWGRGDHHVGWMYHSYDVWPAPLTEIFLRARSREEAKEMVRTMIPNASFFR